jgi:hypothetical protein
VWIGRGGFVDVWWGGLRSIAVKPGEDGEKHGGDHDVAGGDEQRSRSE